MTRKINLLSIILLLIVGILYSCTGTENEASLTPDVANSSNAKIYAKEGYDKTQRILTLDANKLGDEHNNILRRLSEVSKTNFYESKEDIYKSLSDTEVGLDTYTKDEVFKFVDENSDVEKNIATVINQLNTTEAKELYLNINNQLDSNFSYESIINTLNNNTTNIESIKDDFDKQVLRIFVATSKSSAHYWYVETENTTSSTSRATPKWVKKDGNGIAQASIGWAIGAAFTSGPAAPATYFIAVAAGGALSSIWPD